jgi:hypothetical protein
MPTSRCEACLPGLVGAPHTSASPRAASSRPACPRLSWGAARCTPTRVWNWAPTVPIGAGRWKVVGILDAGGSAFDSEVWADANVLNAFYQRPPGVYQSATARPRLSGSIRRVRGRAGGRPPAPAVGDARAGLLRETVGDGDHAHHRAGRTGGGRDWRWARCSPPSTPCIRRSRTALARSPCCARSASEAGASLSRS